MTDSAMLPGPARQAEIYVSGTMHGTIGPVPTGVDALEAKARGAMSAQAAAYICGGAGAERTMAANRGAFDRWAIAPRMLCDVAARDLGVELFGARLRAPLLLAPIGVQEMAHPDADRASARAAAAEGVPLIISNQSSVAMEALADAMGVGVRWMQLYWGKSPELVASLAARAEACGCAALVVTLDTPILGWRPRDLDLGHLPFLAGKGIAQYTSDPVFRSLLAVPPEEDPLAAARLFMGIYSNPALTWDDLAFLRARTRLPILLKGICHADDARMALAHGMDGVIVSNHGGRQVDGAIAALDALGPVADAVGGRVPVLMDSGVRTAADMFKALALGANAVCLGRPYVYGLAIDGEAGARAVIRNLVAEFDLTCGLAGVRNVGEIGRERLTAA